MFLLKHQPASVLSFKKATKEEQKITGRAGPQVSANMCNKKWNYQWLLWVFFSLIPLLPNTALAEDARIAVLYPEASGGYWQLFDTIIEGIENTDNASILTMELTSRTDPTYINKWIAENKIQSVIALGSSGYKFTGLISTDIPIVLGALVISSDEYSGISLAGDPDLFIKYLTQLAPQVKRVFVVYSEKNSGWLVTKAKNAAQKKGIELIGYRADSIKEGLQHYDKILADTNGNTDSIWLPLDHIVPDNVILPKLLRSAWSKKTVIFSNSLIHAKHGVLFSLYPDHKKMGENLGELAIEHTKDRKLKKLLPAKSLKLAVNKRTASHLGLNYTKKQLREFDIVFPSE